jgi:transcriptional regulator with XRE-family HTH domain
MQFAEKLKQLREAAGMTQSALAIASGVPLPTLRDYEQGKRRRDPSLGTTVKLAAALGTDCRAFAECVEDAKKGKAKKRKGE